MSREGYRKPRGQAIRQPGPRVKSGLTNTQQRELQNKLLEGSLFGGAQPAEQSPGQATQLTGEERAVCEMYMALVQKYAGQKKIIFSEQEALVCQMFDALRQRYGDQGLSEMIASPPAPEAQAEPCASATDESLHTQMVEEILRARQSASEACPSGGSQKSAKERRIEEEEKAKKASAENKKKWRRRGAAFAIIAGTYLAIHFAFTSGGTRVKQEELLDAAARKEVPRLNQAAQAAPVNTNPVKVENPFVQKLAEFLAIGRNPYVVIGFLNSNDYELGTAEKQLGAASELSKEISKPERRAIYESELLGIGPGYGANENIAADGPSLNLVGLFSGYGAGENVAATYAMSLGLDKDALNSAFNSLASYMEERAKARSKVLDTGKPHHVGEAMNMLLTVGQDFVNGAPHKAFGAMANMLKGLKQAKIADPQLAATRDNILATYTEVLNEEIEGRKTFVRQKLAADLLKEGGLSQ